MASSRRKRKARARAQSAAKNASNVISITTKLPVTGHVGRPKAGGEYYKCGKRKQAVQGIDMGPIDREQHAGGLIVEEYEEVQNGKRIIARRRMRAVNECALDTLYSNGALGRGDEAALRRKAAEWLRALHIKLHPGVTTNPGYGTGHQSLRFGVHRWSDAQEIGQAQVSLAIKAMRTYSGAVVEACCDDVVTKRTYALCKGLDLLVKHRGLV